MTKNHKAQKLHEARAEAVRNKRSAEGAYGERPTSRVIKQSKFGFNPVNSPEPAVPPHGPGNRKIPMNLAKVNLPPAYEDDDE